MLSDTIIMYGENLSISVLSIVIILCVLALVLASTTVIAWWAYFKVCGQDKKIKEFALDFIGLSKKSSKAMVDLERLCKERHG